MESKISWPLEGVQVWKVWYGVVGVVSLVRVVPMAGGTVSAPFFCFFSYANHMLITCQSDANHHECALLLLLLAC